MPALVALWQDAHQGADKRRTAYSSRCATLISSRSSCSPIWLGSGLSPRLRNRQPIVKLVTFTILLPPVEPAMTPLPEVVVFFENKQNLLCRAVKQFSLLWRIGDAVYPCLRNQCSTTKPIFVVDERVLESGIKIGMFQDDDLQIWV